MFYNDQIKQTKAGYIVLLVIIFLGFNSTSYADILHDYNPYNYSIPDYPGPQACSDILLSGAPSGAYITNVRIYYEVRHTCPWDLDVWLTAYYNGSWHDYYLYHQGDLGCDPDDIVETRDNLHTWDGASPNQEWHLCVHDRAGGDVGYIDFFEIWVTYNIPLPDLIIQDITISPNPPISGQSVTITATSCNIGDGDAGPFNICYYLDGSLIGTDRVSWGLNPGQCDDEQHTHTGYVSCGDHTVMVRVDCDNEVQESNENNNTRDETYEWQDIEDPEITLVVPNGGQDWDIGSQHNITWNRSDNCGITHYKIDYSTNGGTNWIPIIGWTQGNPNSYPWTIPNTPSTNCRVRVCCRDAANNVGCDASNNNFTIRDQSAPTVEVESPNGGEEWDCGETENITWTRDDNVGVTEYAIEYSTDGGTNYEIVQYWTQGNPNSYPWLIPNTPSTACKVMVYVRDAVYNTSWDASNNNFTIRDQSAPTVQVTNPNGGEELYYGNTFDITWSGFDNVGITHHRIRLSTDGGSNWEIIQDWTSGNPGSHPWTIPDRSSPNCKIEVCCRDAATNIGCDASDGYFTIHGTSPVEPQEEDQAIPVTFSLSQNYPNPFNLHTTIKFALPEDSYVSVNVYDLMGNHIITLINGTKQAGYHQIVWDATDFASGVYFYRIEAGDFTETRKMLVIK